MAQARKGSSKNSKLSILLMGDVGSCKSEKALEMMLLKRPDGSPFRVLYLDIENGSIDDRLGRFQKEHKVNLDNLYIIYTQSVVEVLEYIGYARNGDDLYALDDNGNQTSEIVLDADGQPFRPDAIVVDGMALLTASKKMSVLETSKQRAKVRVADKKMTGTKALVTMADAKLEPADYQQINNEGIRIVLALVGSGKHFIITSFTKDEREEVTTGEVDSWGNPKKIKTGRLIPDAFAGLMEYCKTVIVLQADAYTRYKAFVQDKDRTETFEPNEEIENFNMTQFQGVVDKGGDFVVRCDYDKNIQKDVKQTMAEQNPFNAVADKQVATTTPNTTQTSGSVATTTSQTDMDTEVLRLQDECANLINSGTTALEKKALVNKLKNAGVKSGGIRGVTNIEELQKYLKILTEATNK